jgi:glycine cleavage system aminomethyltransferase T
MKDFDGDAIILKVQEYSGRTKMELYCLEPRGALYTYITLDGPKARKLAKKLNKLADEIDPQPKHTDFQKISLTPTEKREWASTGHPR